MSLNTRIFFAHHRFAAERAAMAGHIPKAHLYVPSPEMHPREYASFAAAEHLFALVTMNPYLLDEYGYDEVSVIGPTGEVAPLTAHPECAAFSEVMKPGEFIASVGEEWVR